ncbi:MAG TPA: hypothetical protein VK249_33630, partial [Anaerolineales bacterium]|nr:hypothetical protein [Anaerolineales bacterium]
MKRNVSIIGVVLMLLASACAPKSTPTANPVDVQHTAEAAAFTMVAQTQQALPTASPEPPTSTPSPILLATNTVPPLPTTSDQSTLPALPTTGAQGTQQAFPASIPTFTPQSSQNTSNNQEICNQPLTSWQGPTANFIIVNQTKPQGTIILSMYVVTELNQCGYLIVTGDSFSGPIGQYSAAAFITGKKNMKAFGSFRITEGKWKIAVRNDS